MFNHSRRRFLALSAAAGSASFLRLPCRAAEETKSDPYVGLPMGIWALLVLRKPEVQAAFAAPKPKPGPSSDWKRLLHRGLTLLNAGVGLPLPVPLLE